MIIRFSKIALLLYPRCHRVYCQEKVDKGVKQLVEPFPKKHMFTYIMKKTVEKGEL